MELNWSTFILEIINFLILVWILKRFFYKPVLNVIARRRADIEKTMESAQSLQRDAEALQKQYENRLTDWEQERQAAQLTLDKEIQGERERQMAALQGDLHEEREKAQVIVRRQLETDRLQTEETALAQGAQFAAKLLSSAACPELERRLMDLLLGELSTLPAEQLNLLHTAAGKSPGQIRISSAYPIDNDNRLMLEHSLGKLLLVSGPFHYEQDKALLAGLRINVGAWVLRANLQDELSGFMGFNHEA